jgi:hypothetical protein
MFRIPAQPRGPARGPLRALRAALGFASLLAGALFLQVGRTLDSLGQLWGGPRIAAALQALVTYFSQGVPEGLASDKRPGGWEQRLRRVGPAVVLSIVTVWLCMWLLALLGGGIAWLMLNGYGAWLLLGCVLLGAALGLWLAHVGAKSPPNARAN